MVFMLIGQCGVLVLERFSIVLETSNREDPFAVAVKKSGETITHVPRTISCVCSLLRMKQLSPDLECPTFWRPGTNELT